MSETYSPVSDMAFKNMTDLFPPRLLAKKGIEFYLLPVTNIVCFYCENRVTYVRETGGNKYIVEKPLVELEAILGKYYFIRVAKNILLNTSHVQKFRSLDSGKIEVYNSDKTTIVVNQFYAAAFRKHLRDHF